MTDSVQVALIVSAGPTITALASLLLTLRNHGKMTEVQAQVVEVKHEFNDRMTQFMKAKDDLADSRVVVALAEGAKRESERPK
jgi:hypothetical protein